MGREAVGAGEGGELGAGWVGESCGLPLRREGEVVSICMLVSKTWGSRLGGWLVEIVFDCDVVVVVDVVVGVAAEIPGAFELVEGLGSRTSSSRLRLDGVFLVVQSSILLTVT